MVRENEENVKLFWRKRKERETWECENDLVNVLKRERERKKERKLE